MSELYIAIQISVIGMLLILAAMILLWTVLSLMVFVLAKVEPASVEEIESQQAEDEEELLRQHAVAIAVSTAIQQRSLTRPGRFPLPPTAFVSAWQAVLRSHFLNKRGIGK